MRINALNISDLSELPRDDPTPTYNTTPTQPPPAPAQAQAQPKQQASFVDPAILSVGRRPASGTPTKEKVPDRGVQGASPLKNSAASDSASNGLAASFNALMAGKPHDALGVEPPTTPKTQKKKTRSRQPKATKTQAEQDELEQDEPPVSAHKAHGKGWRQTPILQSTSSFQPFKALKRNGKVQKGTADNGWASEDVTEEMPEFDFENNLAKFDKRTIFDQMRKDDAIDDADRLVSHNRLQPKPGTSGGKNLHYTENVLDLPSAIAQNADFWNSEADVGAQVDDRREPRNGVSMKRTESKPGATRRSQSRKASTAMGGQPLSRVNSGVRQSLPSRRSTPRSGYRSADHIQQQLQQPGLYLEPSHRRLEAISTLQMLNLENIAANEIGFTESLMAENAGRGIAEVAVTALSDPAMKVRYELATASSATEAASLSTATIVVLASNNKSSIRAMVAARHLRNKGFDVVVCLVGIERERDLLEDLRRQVQLYRSFGGKVRNKNDFFEYLRSSSASSAKISVSLIIDALLGLTMSFEELRIGDQATVYELMEWANRNEAFVLSVDIPSGIDPTTGKVAIIDGGQLYIKPRYVVAIGAPKRGLLEAVTPADEDGIGGGVAQEEEWRLFIADMGLGNAVWRKAGTKIRKGIDFDGKWVLEMRYHGEPEASDED